jgi:hypothetical protein
MEREREITKVQSTKFKVRSTELEAQFTKNHQLQVVPTNNTHLAQVEVAQELCALSQGSC